MGLIFFQGLNCYSSSMINAAAFTGIANREAFADLWSETDFTYDQIHHLFLSRRLPRNLELLGARMEFLNCCSREEREKNISALPLGQCLVAGMDAFFISWVPFYQTLHSLHYFIARKERKNVFSCYDPTYDKQNLEITEEHMVSYASDIYQIHKSAEKPFHVEIRQEAQRILDTHYGTQEKLLAQIMECTYEKYKNGELLAKYIDAFINNRYLYLHYLQTMPLPGERYNQYFHREFFQKWTAVKHGLYKASMSRDNQALIKNVCEHLKELITEEMNIAREISLMI